LVRPQHHQCELAGCHADGAAVNAGGKVTVSGIAWDAGYGINAVEVSGDGGANWAAAALGEDLGRFAMRPFTHAVPVPTKGSYKIMARASNRIGQTQASAVIPNPAGYHHNAIQTLTIVAS
jgi:hypothetical protein